MRIGTRRLRSALQLFDDVITPEATDSTTDSAKDSTNNIKSKSAKLEKAVGKLTKALGLVRDIDVMQEWFTSHRPSALSKKEKKIIKALLKTLKKQRKKQFAKMVDMLEGSAYKKVAKQCKRWLKQPTFSPLAQQPVASSAISRIIGPLNTLLQHPGWRLATRKSRGKQRPNKSLTLTRLNQMLEQDATQIHDLRKLIKKIRYQTEFFRPLYGITYAAQIREFRTLQKVLGQLQDQLVIADFLATTLGDQWPEKLPTIHAAFQDSRLDIWRQWQPLQKKYLLVAAQSDATAA